MTIHVVVVDDQKLFRAGIRMILGTQPDIVLVGEASSGLDAVHLVRDLVDVDVVLMDISMPGLDGIDATAAVTALPDPPRVIMLTTFDDDDNIARAIAAGASGFVLKDIRAEMLISAVRSVAEGTAVLARSATLRLAAQHVPSRLPAPASFATLTERERAVFTLAATGLNNAEIAQTAFLSEATVKSYVSRILGKLGLRDRVQLVLFAIRHELTD
ncbi:response regulator transcription factor [Rhodococcus sp. H29-C3]|uniref:response regulator n=1 Tax=Rhodococcus sp. H29-C3 TaxID=3046307 RepID=UPI0024BAE3D0|nr:response regulator transcription factor [Rhodococcus sp. H29-C3]MDJ0363405.1 response regulator transcription factor [Rhodococcus sp. H29-C3]